MQREPHSTHQNPESPTPRTRVIFMSWCIHKLKLEKRKKRKNQSTPFGESSSSSSCSRWVLSGLWRRTRTCPEHGWVRSSGSEVKDRMEDEVEKHEAGAGQGQEHHPVRHPQSHPPTPLFSPLFSARLTETERQRDRDEAEKWEAMVTEREWIGCLWFVDGMMRFPLPDVSAPRGLRSTRVESSIRLLTLHASSFFD